MQMDHASSSLLIFRPCTLRFSATVAIPDSFGVKFHYWEISYNAFPA